MDKYGEVHSEQRDTGGWRRLVRHGMPCIGLVNAGALSLKLSGHGRLGEGLIIHILAKLNTIDLFYTYMYMYMNNRVSKQHMILDM